MHTVSASNHSTVRVVAAPHSRLGPPRRQGELPHWAGLSDWAFASHLRLAPRVGLIPFCCLLTHRASLETLGRAGKGHVHRWSWVTHCPPLGAPEAPSAVSTQGTQGIEEWILEQNHTLAYQQVLGFLGAWGLHEARRVLSLGEAWVWRGLSWGVCLVFRLPFGDARPAGGHKTRQGSLARPGALGPRSPSPGTFAAHPASLLRQSLPSLSFPRCGCLWVWVRWAT